MSEALAPLLAALKDLVRWIKAERVPGAVVGGVAASLLGRPRVTRDVDALILLTDKDWETFLATGERFSFRPRQRDVLGFARTSHVLLMTHQPSSIDADIVFGTLPFEKEAVMRAVQTRIAGTLIPLVTAEDLVIMKAVANRAHDLRDIESLLDANDDIDLRRVRRWVKHFSAVLETPEILDDLQTLIAKHRRSPRKRVSRKKK